MRDYVAWHDGYADPNTSLARRLAVVRHHVAGALDAIGGDGRILSLCAGDGRDVIEVLAERPARHRPATVLVELDPALADTARRRAEDVGVEVEVITGDAGATATFAHHLPADVVLLCGIFGNVSEADIATTVATVPAMVAPGGFVIWTRGWFADQPDRRPAIRSWFADTGLDEVAFDSEPQGYGVGVARSSEESAAPTDRPLPERLFTFVR